MEAKFQQRNICVPTQKISTSLLRICVCPHKIHDRIILNRMGAKFQQRNICVPKQKMSTSLLMVCVCLHKIHYRIILNRMGAKFQQRNICVPTQKISTSLLKVGSHRTQAYSRQSKYEKCARILFPFGDIE